MVRTSTAADEAAVIDVIVLAFANDPVARWCWNDSHRYLSAMPPFVRAFGGGAFNHHTAHCTDNYEGGALWLPPDVHSDEDTIAEILERTVGDALRSELFGVFEQMAKYHPNEPHWYLPLIGVDPVHQGRGHGGSLLSYALKRCDHEKRLAYLESTNPRNVPLYERYGFERLGTIQVGSSPPLVPMLRKPR